MNWARIMDMLGRLGAISPEPATVAAALMALALLCERLGGTP